MQKEKFEVVESHQSMDQEVGILGALVAAGLMQN
jgi:hypothetical protein